MLARRTRRDAGASWSRTTASASTRRRPPVGTGLANLRDRIESAGGTLTTGTTPGGGTRIRARLPAPDSVDRRSLTAGVAEVTARIAWVLTGITLVAVVADIVVTAQYRTLFSEDAVAVHGFPFVDLAVLGAAVLGALILTQDGRHPIGLLLLLIGFTGAVSLLTEAYSIWVIDENGPGSRSLAGVVGLGVVPARRPAVDRRDRPDLPARAGRTAALATLAVRRGGHGARRAPVRGVGAHPEPAGLRPQRQDRLGSGCSRESWPRWASC